MPTREGMRPYIAFYGSKKIQVFAHSPDAAQTLATGLMEASPEDKVSVFEENENGEANLDQMQVELACIVYRRDELTERFNAMLSFAFDI